MNRAQRLESIIRSFGGSATLGEILSVADSRDDFGLKHSFTNATDELRKDLVSRTPKETLVWTRGKTASQGLYTIFPARVEGNEVVAVPRQLLLEPEMDQLNSKGGTDGFVAL